MIHIQGGNQKLDYVDIRDVTKAILNLVEMPHQEWPQVLNIGSGKQITLLELVQRIAKVSKEKFGRELSYTIEDKEIKLELGMNIDKAMKCIGWKPIISMEQTIADQWPSKFNQTVLDDLTLQIEKLSEASGYFDGPINIEARINQAGEVFVIEMGARNGGNFVPIIQNRLTGFDYVDAALRISLGEKLPPPELNKNGIGAHYILHAEQDAIFSSVKIDDRIKPFIFFQKVFKKTGDKIYHYCGSDTTIGILLLEFQNIEMRDKIMAKVDTFVKIDYV